MKYKKKEDLVCEKIDGEIIVFDSDAEKFYEFDSVGSFIWEILENLDIKKISEEVCKSYDIEPDNALEDVEQFLQDLQVKGLIILED